MNSIEDKFEEKEDKAVWTRTKDYWNGCIDPNNDKLYGTFQQRAALNITKFPKIQGSLLIRMGMVYPIVSSAIEYLGVPKESSTEILGLGINYHTWLAGYMSYLIEIQLGLSKYAFEGIGKVAEYVKVKFSNNTTLS